MRILVLLAEGFEEIEAITVIDILRRAEVKVETAGLKDGSVEGSHKIRIVPDTFLDKIDHNNFDGLIIPGGSPGFTNLGNDTRVLDMIREMDRAGKYLGAICAGPSVLVNAGILHGRRATVSPSRKTLVEACAQYSDERVVIDRNLITSQSPGTAMEFALKMVEVLAGEDKMKEIKAQTLAIFKGD